MPPTNRPGFVDPRGVRFAGGLTGTVALSAVLLPLIGPGAGAVSGGLAVLLLAAAVGGARANAWGHLFRRVVRPRLGRPAYLEPEAPPRFANLLGGLVLAAGTAAFLVGADPWGQVAAGVVSGLAYLNAFGNFCVGCKLYGLLVRPRVRSAPA